MENGIQIRNGHESQDGISPEAVNLALTRILASAPFHASKQSQDLLRYLVEKALTNRGEVLKERTIGIEVFGRKPTYSTADDPIVRSRAGEVRKRLAQYYQSEAALDCAIRIALQPFSYRPTFTIAPEADGKVKILPTQAEGPAASSESEAKHEEVDADTPIPRIANTAKHYSWGISFAAVVGLFFLGWIVLFYPQRTELDLFWRPIFQSKKPVLIFTGTNSVYYPVHYPDSDFFRNNPVASEGQLSGLRDILPPLGEGQTLTSKDIEPNNDDYVQVEDIAANVDVARLLTAHRVGFELRSGSVASFEDFQDSSAVLIGAFSNPSWALNLTGNLSYVFDRNRNIRERGGQNRTWSTIRTSGSSEQAKVVEDYSIVSKLLDSKTGNMRILIAGLTTCGTRAAADFVGDPSQMEKLKSVPKKPLENSNLQIVLHSKFVNCVPVSTDVVALRYW